MRSLRVLLVLFVFLTAFGMGRITARTNPATLETKTTPSVGLIQALSKKPVIRTGTTSEVETYSCQGALEPNLSVGNYGLVHNNDPRPVNLRLEPGTGAELIGQLSVDTTFLVLDGPYCVQSMNWYQIRQEDTDLVGFMAEGSDFYFVIPLIR